MRRVDYLLKAVFYENMLWIADEGTILSRVWWQQVLCGMRVKLFMSHRQTIFEQVHKVLQNFTRNWRR